MGRPIPAGTGLTRYKDLTVKVEEETLKEAVGRSVKEEGVVPVHG